MDKLKDNKTKSRKVSEQSFFSKLGGEGGAFLFDIFFFILGALFSRCHLLFGAYPLGVALISLLPHSVIPAMLGAVLGALMMGADGIVYASIYGVVVILRIILSSGNGRSSYFGEALLVRMSVAVIGGFAAAVCEVLVRGLELTSLFFGLCMIFLSPLAVFCLSGLFDDKINIKTVLSSEKNLLSLKGTKDKERFDIIFFEISALVFVFLISLSLEKFVFFGISVSYIFITAVTLLSAKRLGAFSALAVGFISSFAVSGIHSVSFALLGLSAGAFFSLGTAYAIIIGGGAIAAWSYYMSGMVGLLSTLPEYLIGAAFISPFLGGVKPTEKEEPMPEADKSAQEMVGTIALTYQKKYSRSLDSLELSLTSLSGVISDYSASKSKPSGEEYRSIVIETAEEHCKNCTGRKFCMIENIRPCLSNLDTIVEKLSDGLSVCPEDVNGDTEFCQKAEAVAESINERVAKAEESRFKLKDADATAEEYALISKLINEARCRDEEERCVNSALTDALTRVLSESEIENGMIRAFGTRRKHIILAGEDETGDKITSPKLRGGIERAIGVRLGKPEYFRKGKMALMECDIVRTLSAECAKASSPGTGGEISGDSISLFESSDDCFYALISDGMGSGKVAMETSDFVCRFLTRALDFGASKETVLHMLNYIIRRKGEECSATVDLFEIDLLSGEATFIKSGAAPSFVKRGSSLFRIKSQTAPIGLLKTIDTERIKVEVQAGDYVIMLSDGIAQTVEDAPWLIELVANSTAKTPELFAAEILEEAKRRSVSDDDMSVVVLKIDEI